MKTKRISASLRRRVSAQSGFRCGYCLTPEMISGARMVLDHIIPQAAGGLTTEENLWLACHSCNEFKGAQVQGRDRGGRRVRIFDPRRQRWRDHFAWGRDGTRIISLSSCGEATSRRYNSIMTRWFRQGVYGFRSAGGLQRAEAPMPGDS